MRWPSRKLICVTRPPTSAHTTVPWRERSGRRLDVFAQGPHAHQRGFDHHRACGRAAGGRRAPTGPARRSPACSGTDAGNHQAAPMAPASATAAMREVETSRVGSVPLWRPGGADLSKCSIAGRAMLYALTLKRRRQRRPGTPGWPARRRARCPRARRGRAPVPLDAVTALGDQRIELLPQVDIFHRLLEQGAPALAFQPATRPVMPWRTYWLSRYRSTSHGRRGLAGPRSRP